MRRSVSLRAWAFLGWLVILALLTREFPASGPNNRKNATVAPPPPPRATNLRDGAPRSFWDTLGSPMPQPCLFHGVLTGVSPINVLPATVNYLACRKSCRKNDSCVAWTWDHLDGRSCKLYDSYEKASVSPAADSDHLQLTGGAPCRFPGKKIETRSVLELAKSLLDSSHENVFAKVSTETTAFTYFIDDDVSKPLVFLAPSSDFGAGHVVEGLLLRELESDAYKLRELPATISGVALDVGAHFGFMSISTKKYRPDLTVIAIEPSRENLFYLKWNALVNEVDVTAIHGALTKPHSADVYVVENSSDSTGTRVYSGKSSEGGYKVPALDLNELSKRYDFDHLELMKLDCEGCEFEVVPSYYEWFSSTHKIKRFRGELHHRKLPFVTERNATIINQRRAVEKVLCDLSEGQNALRHCDALHSDYVERGDDGRLSLVKSNGKLS